MSSFVDVCRRCRRLHRRNVDLEATARSNISGAASSQGLRVKRCFSLAYDLSPINLTLVFSLHPHLSIITPCLAVRGFDQVASTFVDQIPSCRQPFLEFRWSLAHSSFLPASLGPFLRLRFSRHRSPILPAWQHIPLISPTVPDPISLGAADVQSTASPLSSGSKGRWLKHVRTARLSRAACWRASWRGSWPRRCVRTWSDPRL